MGCQLTATVEDGFVTKVEGNQCPRGEKYAKTEVVNPVRTLTTTVKVLNGDPLPVKSAAPLRKDKLFDCMAVLRNVTVTAPVSMGAIIVGDLCGTGVDMVSTASIGQE
jgi:CxxC motif-containing protein